jgi:hypothetical protein
MPRIYTIGFENVAVSAAQDLVSVKGSTGKICRLLRAWLGATDTTIQTAQGLRIRFRYMAATITLGSGGTGSPTIQPVDPGDAAASFTAHTNDTSQATTSGTAFLLVAQGCHNYAGLDFSFPRPQIFGLNEGVTFELLSTVTGTCHFSGGVEIEESGS